MREFVHRGDDTPPAIALGLDRAIESWGGLIDALPVGVYVCDSSGLLVQYNRRAAELWGRSPPLGDGSVLFCGAVRAFRANGQPLPLDESPMNEVLRTGQPIRGREICMERADGARLMLLVNADPLHDSAGRLVGGVNCFQDITESKRAESLLRERDERLRELLDALPAAIYTTDAEGRVTYFNRAAVELSGRIPAAGDRWCVTWRLLWPDGSSMPHDECPMAVALKEKRAVRGTEAIALRPDGTRVPFIPYPTPLRDRSGAITGAVNMLVDISARKHSETRQRVLLEELNHRVKNNMQMLHALLKVAERDAGSVESRTVLSDAAKRVAAMAAAQQVLYEADDPTTIDGGRFVAAVCANAQQAFGTDVEIVMDPGACRLANDRAVPIALILNELLTNAVKHGEAGLGERAIRVGLWQDAAAIVLRVEDRGPGFTLEETGKRSSGLGLVLGLVRQLGGAMEIARAGGARCTVRIPEQAPAA